MVVARRFRLSLAMLIVATVAPLALFAAIVVALFSLQQRGFLEKQLDSIAQSMSIAVDHEIAIHTATLHMLVSAPALRHGDLQGFYELASQLVVAPTGAGVFVTLTDAQSGEVVLDTNQRLGAKLGQDRFPEAIRRMTEQRPDILSNVVPRGVYGEEPLILFRAPVAETAQPVRYVVTLAVRPLPIEQYLSGQAVPKDWRVTILDPEGIVAARSHDAGLFVGTSSSENARQAIRERRDGLHAGRNLEGTDVYALFHRSPYTGWWVLAAVPQNTVDAPVRRSLLAIGGSGALLLVLALGISLSWVRQLERKQLEEERRRHQHDELDRQKMDALEKARQQAEAASLSKSWFLSNMSHELRTPLNAIIGFSDAMLDDALDANCPPRCRGYLRNINEAGLHLLEIINDILDMSKVESGDMTVENHPVDVQDVVAACLRMVTDRAAHANISLSMHMGQELPFLQADPLRLKQVLLNLLSNAVKFTPEGGQVSVGCEADAQGMTIQVADTGIGMDEAGMRVALSPFGQVESHLARRWQGTGLGLPLADRLTQLLGGDMTLQSQPGKGTIVRLSFSADRLLVDTGKSPVLDEG